MINWNHHHMMQRQSVFAQNRIVELLLAAAPLVLKIAPEEVEMVVASTLQMCNRAATVAAWCWGAAYGQRTAIRVRTR